MSQVIDESVAEFDSEVVRRVSNWIVAIMSANAGVGILTFVVGLSITANTLSLANMQYYSYVIAAVCFSNCCCLWPLQRKLSRLV